MSCSEECDLLDIRSTISVVFVFDSRIASCV